MAFNFLGTFRRSQFEALIAYAEAHLANVAPRLEYLKGELERLGWLEYTFDDGGNRVDYRILPVNSTLAKYVRVYEFYGGSLTDLQIRSRGDWIYITKGEFDLSDAAPYAGGKPSEGPYPRKSMHLDDTVPGTHVARVKDWLVPGLKRKREDLEYRIKRTVDRGDQHIEEIVLLIKRSTGADTLEKLRRDIEYFIASEDYPSATED